MADCKENGANFEFASDANSFDEGNDVSLVGTQPIKLEDSEFSEETFEELSCQDVWGWLQPTPNSKFASLALEKDTYTFGRHLDCDYVFKEEYESHFGAMSKFQFKIEKKVVNKDADIVLLYDLSMNGTFVNQRKVGKGEHTMLTNNDEISLIFPNNRVFVFIDNSFIRDWMPPKMKERYNLKILLGNGAYGEVRMAKDKKNDRDVAIKKIKKHNGNERFVKNEIEILQKLKHHFIVSMEDVFDSPHYVYIVLEYISGGTLTGKVRSAKRLKNEEAKIIFYQLVLALEYLHLQGVAHRDLKPDNVLIASYKEGDLVKVSDFGLSKLSGALDTGLKTMCGTLYFTAPEILLTNSLGKYTHQVDIWSLGVTLFFCLSGTYPFSEERQISVTEQIIRGSYRMYPEHWKGVPPEAISIIRKMLVGDPSQRIAIPGLLQHPWLQDDVMKKKIKKLLKCVLEDDSVGIPRPSKRLRIDNSADTLRKS